MSQALDFGKRIFLASRSAIFALKESSASTQMPHQLQQPLIFPSAITPKKKQKWDIGLMQYKETVTHKQEMNIRILTY